MKCFETEHYIFYHREGTKAEADIEEIAAHQEACFRYICGVLHVDPAFKIKYFLCDSPKEVGRVYGDDDPCNGFAVMPNTIYAVYNEEVQCIGFHEDVHILSYTVNRPDSPAIREGLAMYFDRKWWGIHNLDWVGFFIKKGLYLSVDTLLDRRAFFDADCAITYPIMGAFTDYLIGTYGRKAYMDFYSRQDMALALEAVYHKTPAELNGEFTAYVQLFRLDPVLEKRMEALQENVRNI